MQQWKGYAQDCDERAGGALADRFITAVEEALRFISQNPYACAVYETGEGYEDLQVHKFRKWNLQGFPHLVLFRVTDKSTILIEVLYAHKMDIQSRVLGDRE
jgi:hypothetical protein